MTARGPRGAAETCIEGVVDVVNKIEPGTRQTA
jgi:hypothetical protein